MSFIVPTTDQTDIVEAGGYRARDYILITPLDAFFVAHPAADSAANLISEIAYTLVSGDYTEIRRDMTVLITTGQTLDELKRPLWRGRVRKAATSGTLYINPSSITLDTDYFIVVLDQYEPTFISRNGTFLDWDLPFEKLPPAIKGLQSSYVKEPVAGEAQFTFAPEADPVEQNATIDDDTAWHWEIDGATYDTGDADTREITVTIPEGHTWATVTCEDSFGTVATFIFEIYVVDRYSSSYVYAGAEGAEISSNWNDGVNASVRYFEGAEDILDRQRVTIVTFEKYRDGDAEFPNIAFVGYFRQNDDAVRADAQYGALKERSFKISGFASIMGQLKHGAFRVTDTALESACDDMLLPTPGRVTHHIAHHLLNIGRFMCIDYGETISLDWYTADIDVEDEFGLPAANAICDRINAQLIFAPDGQVMVRRNITLVEDDADRDAADVVATIGVNSLLSVEKSNEQIGDMAQLTVGMASFATLDKTQTLIRATAPAEAFAEGSDFDEKGNQLLKSNLTEAQAKTAAGKRAGNLFAYQDNSNEMTWELDAGWRWAQPSNFQWWKGDIPASKMPDGVELTPDTRLLLKSLTHKFNPARGTRTCTAVVRYETKGGLTQILVEKIPAEVPTALSPLPTMSPYMGAFNPYSTRNSTSQTPARSQPYNGRTGGVISLPGSPAQQDQAGSGLAQPGCRNQTPPVNFRNSSNVVTGFSTLNGGDYTLHLSGKARIATAAWVHHLNMVTGDNGFSLVAGQGTYTPGVGFTDTYVQFGTSNGYRGISIKYVFGGSCDLTFVRMYFTYSAGSFYIFSTDSSLFIGQLPSPRLKDILIPNIPSSPNTWTGSGTLTELQLDLICGHTAGVGDPGGNVTLTAVDVGGLGTNPFTLEPGVNLEGDAFYQWDADAEDPEAELLPDYRGFRLNSMPVSVPPEYNPNHEYDLTFVGDGNPAQFIFQDDNFSDNQNALLRITICGAGAGR